MGASLQGFLVTAALCVAGGVRKRSDEGRQGGAAVDRCLLDPSDLLTVQPIACVFPYVGGERRKRETVAVRKKNESVRKGRNTGGIVEMQTK